MEAEGRVLSRCQSLRSGVSPPAVVGQVFWPWDLGSGTFPLLKGGRGLRGGRGRGTRYPQGPKRGAEEDWLLEGEPCRSAPAPRLIRFVSSPALGCQLSPGRGTGGGRSAAGWDGQGSVCVCVCVLGAS